MGETICPACERNRFEPCESIDVTEQHRLYSPDNQKTQQELNEAAFETASSYQMLKCLHCGLEFCDPLKAPSAEWYKLTYRALDFHSQGRWEFDEVLRRVGKGAGVFEFGCGSGSFLMHCRDRGVTAAGMDFSEDGVASCLAEGLDARQIELDEISEPGDSDRVPHLVAFHFLEHLDKPSNLFRHAAARALPSAHLWVSVPGDRRATRRFGVRDFLDQPPHHMTRWTPDAFREIGERHGWRLTEVAYEPIRLRTAVWSITFYSPAYQRRKSAGKFQNYLVEKAYRVLALPLALIRRLGKDRQLSGFSMMAHFVFKGRSAAAGG